MCPPFAAARFDEGCGHTDILVTGIDAPSRECLAQARCAERFVILRARFINDVVINAGEVKSAWGLNMRSHGISG